MKLAKAFFYVVILSFISCQFAFSLDNEIAQIEVVGNQKIEKVVILNSIATKEGKAFSHKQLREDIRQLYKLGYFEHIGVYKKETPKGLIITYVLTEKPTIRNILIEGNKKIETENIEKVVTLKKYSFLNLSYINQSQEAIITLYGEKGFYLVDVRHEVKPVKESNEVDVYFYISEIDKVQIKKMTFIGNKKFSDKELKKIMFTKEKDIWSWITKSGVFQEEIFQRDVEQGLAYFYLSHGYVSVKVRPPQVSITPDKKWIYLTVIIEEGDQYKFGDVKFAGDLVFPQKELLKGSIIEKGEIYNHDFVRQEILRMTNLYKDQGYAYANVIPTTNINEQKKDVDIVFQFERGEKVRFGSFYMVGNVKTRDKVIRRELKVKESEVYNESDLQESIARLNYLGYFSEVDVQKKEGRDSKALDLYFNVKEKNTGSFNLGAGYSTTTSFFIQSSISQNNLFGFGQFVDFMAQLSGKSQLFNVSFREPYLLDTLWNAGFDVFKSQREPIDFTENHKGGSFLFGHSFLDYGVGRLIYTLDDVSVDIPSANSPPLSKAVNDGLISSITSSFEYDVRDNRLSPSKGSYHGLSFEFAGVGGDKKFWKGSFDTKWYFPFIWSSVLRSRFDLATVQPYGGQILPNYIRFIMGGPNSLRGFRPLSLGPKEKNNAGNDIVVGGNHQILANLEWEAPLLKELQLKGVMFFDYGSAFSRFDWNDLRGDVGFGFRWASPMGPLRLEWGFPLARRAGEPSPVFQFLIAPPF